MGNGPITYMSRGTVRATIRFDKEESDRSVYRSVYFIPTPDYFVKHEGEQFAAFVCKSGNIHRARLAGGDNSVSLECAESLFSVAAIAAATHVQVEIEVEKSTTSVNDCKVVAITVPAKSTNAK